MYQQTGAGQVYKWYESGDVKNEKLVSCWISTPDGVDVELTGDFTFNSELNISNSMGGGIDLIVELQYI